MSDKRVEIQKRFRKAEIYMKMLDELDDRDIELSDEQCEVDDELEAFLTSRLEALTGAAPDVKLTATWSGLADRYDQIAAMMEGTTFSSTEVKTLKMLMQKILDNIQNPVPAQQIVQQPQQAYSYAPPVVVPVIPTEPSKKRGRPRKAPETITVATQMPIPKLAFNGQVAPPPSLRHLMKENISIDRRENMIVNEAANMPFNTTDHNSGNERQ